MLLTPYGRREWIAITLVCALLATAAGWLWPPALALVVLLWIALLSFFRDPLRSPPDALRDGDMLSPADGTVSAVEHVEEHRATAGDAVVVRIFLSVLNVHVNRAPCDGEVVAVEHRPGRYLNAQTEASARVNESNLIVLRRPGGETIGVRQVAGMLARRIVCPLAVGDRLARGEKFGMIKFGSTTELILPRPGDVEVRVRPGDAVRGGRTILATLAEPPP
jgi:phosphatidylserine decarboxylase